MRAVTKFLDLSNTKLAVLGGSLVFLLAATQLVGPEPTEKVDSFAACKEAGYPVELSYPEVCVAGGKRFIGPTTITPAPPPPGQALTVETLVSGEASTDLPKSQKTIRTQTEWERHWREVHRGLSPVPPIIAVDFGKNDVLAAVLGAQQTSGYNLKISSVTASSNKAVAHVVEQVPTIGCVVANKLSNRYVIVRVPKLPADVRFDVSKDYRQC